MPEKLEASSRPLARLEKSNRTSKKNWAWVLSLAMLGARDANTGVYLWWVSDPGAPDPGVYLCRVSDTGVYLWSAPDPGVYLWRVSDPGV